MQAGDLVRWIAVQRSGFRAPETGILLQRLSTNFWKIFANGGKMICCDEDELEVISSANR